MVYSPPQRGDKTAESLPLKRARRLTLPLKRVFSFRSLAKDFSLCAKARKASYASAKAALFLPRQFYLPFGGGYILPKGGVILEKEKIKLIRVLN
jgi:hypothetical protein